MCILNLHRHPRVSKLPAHSSQFGIPTTYTVPLSSFKGLPVALLVNRTVSVGESTQRQVQVFGARLAIEMCNVAHLEHRDEPPRAGWSVPEEAQFSPHVPFLSRMRVEKLCRVGCTIKEAENALGDAELMADLTTESHGLTLTTPPRGPEVPYGGEQLVRM